MNGLCSNVMQNCVIKDEEKMKNRLKKLIFKFLSAAWYVRNRFSVSIIAKTYSEGIWLNKLLVLPPAGKQ